MESEAADPVQRFFENLEKPHAMRAKDEGTVSHEDVISKLMEEEPVEEDGKLKMRPKFFSLPLLAQTRCLHSLMHQHARISSPALHQFISLVEACPHQNSWIEHGVRELKKCVSQNTSCYLNCDNLVVGTNLSNYVFTRESEESKNELIAKLRQGQKSDFHCIQIDSQERSKTVAGTDRTETRNVSSVITATACGVVQIVSEVSGFQSDKMTVINVDSDSNGMKKGHCREMRLEAGKNQVSTEISDDKSMRENMRFPCKKKKVAETTVYEGDNNYIIITSDSDDLVDERDRLTPSPTRKRTYSNNCCVSVDRNGKSDLQENNMEVAGDNIKKHKNEDDSKVQPGSGREETHPFLPEQGTADAGKTEGLKSNQLSELEFQLSSVKENLLADNRDETFASQFWERFMEVDHTQLQAACQFLMLSSLSEETLLALCDSLPTFHLSHQTETAFLQNALSDKLSNLSSRASHTLLNILYSVIKHQPRTIVEILTTSIERSESGEAQCQILVTLCKNYFPVDCVPFFIKQLSLKKIVVNQHLTSVLQAMFNMTFDLDDATLMLLLSTLSKNNETLNTSAPFGKLLLTLVTKFKAKMTNDLKALVTRIVDTHKSSLKKTLVKRLVTLA